MVAFASASALRSRASAGAFGLQHGRLLLALGLEYRRLPEALGLENVGALVALGFHLPAHRVDQVLRRLDVLDLDARHLDAPGHGRIVDHPQQPVVDVVALGEGFVQVHRADHGADVGHGQVDNRQAQVVDLVGRLGRVLHLVEQHRVDPDHSVVLGDHFLAGNIEHLLHHVHAPADALKDRSDEVKARLHGLLVAAEALERVLEPLGDGQPRLGHDH